MSNTDELIKADAARRTAMVSGDIASLDACLADDLSWTHSSGKTDTKRTFLDVMASGTTLYHSLDVRDIHIRAFGDMFILEGVVFGDVTKDGQDKKLVNRFLTIWRYTETKGFRLHAWQSTGLS